MGNFITQLAEQVGGSIPGTIMGMALGGYNDRRQQDQQEALQAIQIKGNKEMTDYQMRKQLEMWKATGYGPQIEQMKAAGINPALMYGMSGGGGQTTGNASGNVTGAAAPIGGREVQDIMGMGLMAAQKRLIEAQAKNIEADTQNKPLTGQNIEASTASLTQGVKNQQAVEALTKVETRLKAIAADIAEATKEEAIQMIDWNTLKALEELDKINRENFIAQATRDNIIDNLNSQLITTLLNNKAIRAGTTLTQTQTAKTAAETEIIPIQVGSIVSQIMQGWTQLGINQQNADTAEKKYELDKWVNDVSEKTKLTVETIKGIVQAILIKSIGKGGTQIPIRGFHER